MKTQIIDSTDCLVLFADPQLGIIELTRTLPIGQLRNGVKGLAKLAKIEDILASIRNCGRRTILICGVATELAVQLPATTAAELGLRAAIGAVFEMAAG
jgi:hypothetical protein